MMSEPNRIVAHLDMDAFYAAIEERDNPRFSGKSIVVGADPKEGRGRGVVSTANYAAREFGIKSAMPISQAYRLAPEAIYLPPDIPKYQKESEKILNTLRSKVPIVEKASTDEFYLDLSHAKSCDDAVGLIEKIKREIKKERGLTASVGVGPNKLIAKIASDQDKPDGLTVVRPDEVVSFLASLDIQKIPGIGPKTAAKFYDMDIEIIGDLRRLSKQELVDIVGVFGRELYNLARGEDNRPVGIEQPVKSIGKQTTFQEDTSDPKVITDTVLKLAGDVWEEVTSEELEPRTVTVIVRYENFETHTKAETPKAPIGDLTELKKTILKLLLPFLGKKKVRLVGVRLSVSSS